MKVKEIEGLRLQWVPKTEYTAKRNYLRLLALYLIAALLLFGLGGSLLTLLGLKIYGLIFSLWALVILGGCFLFAYYPKLRWPLGGLGLCFILIAIFFSGSLFHDGMALCFNSVSSAIGTTLCRSFMPFAVSGNGNELLAATVFAMFLSLIAAVIATYIVVSGSGFSVFLTLLLFVFALVFSAAAPFWLWYGMLFVGLALALLTHSAPKEDKSGDGKLLLGLCTILLSLAVAISGIAALLFSVGSYQPPAPLQAAAAFLEDTGDLLLYGSDKTNNLPEGDFTKIRSLNLTEKPALSVTMAQPEALYLRGYIGDVYTENGWQATDKTELYSYADTFYWLHQEGFYGQTQLSAAAAAGGSNEAEQEIAIENLGAKDKYIYTPYEYSGTPPGDAVYRIGDKAPSVKDFKDSESYAFTAIPNQVRTAAALGVKIDNAVKSGNAQALSYLKNESNYRDFVYATELNLSADALKVLSAHLNRRQVKEGHLDYDEAMQTIIDTLLTEVEYNETVTPFPGNKDFLTYFLEDAAEGYSVHYATAAALIFRYFGIPARYVEGYIITPEDIEGVKSGEKITLTGKNAHAWVEYYRDGIGWLPFEITPAYLFTMVQPDNVSALLSQNDDANSKNEGTTEMTGDNYEKEDETAPSTEENHLSLSQVALIGSGISLFFIIAAFAVLSVLRRKALKRRREQIAKAPPQDAVNMVFKDTLSLLFLAGIPRYNSSLEKYGSPIEELGGKPLALRFSMLMRLHQKAVFSNRPVSAEVVKVFRLYQKEVKRFTIHHRSCWKQFCDRYFKHLY